MYIKEKRERKYERKFKNTEEREIQNPKDLVSPGAKRHNTLPTIKAVRRENTDDREDEYFKEITGYFPALNKP